MNFITLKATQSLDNSKALAEILHFDMTFGLVSVYHQFFSLSRQFFKSMFSINAKLTSLLWHKRGSVCNCNIRKTSYVTLRKTRFPKKFKVTLKARFPYKFQTNTLLI